MNIIIVLLIDKSCEITRDANLPAFNDEQHIFDIIQHLIMTMNVQYDIWNAKFDILNIKFNNLKNYLNAGFDNLEICIMAELGYLISLLSLIIISFTVL